jgi:hypothetical protein
MLEPLPLAAYPDLAGRSAAVAHCTPRQLRLLGGHAGQRRLTNRYPPDHSLTRRIPAAHDRRRTTRAARAPPAGYD